MLHVRPQTIVRDEAPRGPLSTASLFRRAKKLEKNYARQLRRIARAVGDIVTGLGLGDDLAGSPAIRAALHRYAEAIDPWAKAAADRMVTEIAAADRDSWRRMSASIGRLLQKEIETAPTGRALVEAKARQVDLIKSIPREAAERVHKLTTEGMAQGHRTSAIADEIMRSGDVARSRADTIARTEVSRTATELTKARAEHVGSTGYIWRAMHDHSVRPSHKAMNGKFVSWNMPPTLDSMVGHAGCFPNCRCFCEPVLAEGDRRAR